MRWRVLDLVHCRTLQRYITLRTTASSHRPQSVHQVLHPPTFLPLGCISGLTAMYALLYPFSTITVLIIPMPAWVAIGGFCAYDLYKLVTLGGGRTDVAGHVGGACGGLLYYIMNIRR